MTAITFSAPARSRPTGIPGSMANPRPHRPSLRPASAAESLGRFVVTVAPDHKREFERILGADAALLGKTGGSRLRITGQTLLLEPEISKLEAAYKAPFGGF